MFLYALSVNDWDFLGHHNKEERLGRVEATLGDPGHAVTPDQASQISQAVKAVAMELSKKSSRNEYGGVHGERALWHAVRELPLEVVGVQGR